MLNYYCSSYSIGQGHYSLSGSLLLKACINVENVKANAPYFGKQKIASELSISTDSQLFYATEKFAISVLDLKIVGYVEGYCCFIYNKSQSSIFKLFLFNFYWYLKYVIIFQKKNLFFMKATTLDTLHRN